MTTSFTESKNKILNQLNKIKPFAIPITEAGDLPHGYQVSNKYKWYINYEDVVLSFIDDDRNVTVDESQINLTQETNSQFIPFQMPRYADGIDLMEMALQVHFVNSENRENFVSPVNVIYNDSTIQFSWLVDNSATYLEGELVFEIIASGKNEKGENYVWKSRPNGYLNILPSLAGDGSTEPTVALYSQIMERLDGIDQDIEDIRTGASIFAIDGGNADVL